MRWGGWWDHHSLSTHFSSAYLWLYFLEGFLFVCLCPCLCVLTCCLSYLTGHGSRLLVLLSIHLPVYPDTLLDLLLIARYPLVCPSPRPYFRSLLLVVYICTDLISWGVSPGLLRVRRPVRCRTCFHSSLCLSTCLSLVVIH